jgi:PleD family two-component response regulator
MLFYCIILWGAINHLTEQYVIFIVSLNLIFMKAESLKLGIIDRLMKIHSTAALKRMDELISQAELESQANESLKAIDKGDVLSIEEFRKENEAWRKRNIK